LRTVLPRYRRDLIRPDLVRGLDICLQGALRDDLMTGIWSEHVSDDELWDAIVACGPWLNPFAPLGALDITLGRQHDDCYRAFAEEAVKKLVQEEFPRADGIDIYELLPLWATLVLNSINGLEGGVLCPSCWKRMRAWMQAGILVRRMQNVTFELESFRKWVEGNQALAGVYANILDLRHEPKWRAAEMSPRALHGEVIGRLVLLHERHKTTGRRVLGSDGIGEAVVRLTDQGSLGWTLPSPLDGHHRPADTGMNRPSKDDIEKFAADLTHEPDASIRSTFAYLSQRYDLGENLRVRMREMIGAMA
jgi:hypothetical protein